MDIPHEGDRPSADRAVPGRRGRPDRAAIHPRCGHGALCCAQWTDHEQLHGSWANACTLQCALAVAANGDEIWVNEMGVHYPGTNRTDTLTLRNGVALYSGFAGTETCRNSRNWQTNKTILSGDIDQNDTDLNGNGIIEPANGDAIVGNNACHVVTGGETDSTAVLDGFFITAGQANGLAPNESGGGMYNNSGNPTLTNVTFSGNSASSGGGMSKASSSPTLTNVTFSGNSAQHGGWIWARMRSTSTLPLAEPLCCPPLPPAGPSTFSLTLYNPGSLPAAVIVVTDTLAAGQGGVITVIGVLTVPLAAGVYTNTAVITATGDLLAGNNTAVVTFTVANVAPRFTSAPITTAAQDAPYTHTATARDDNGDVLTVTVPTKPAWLVLTDRGDGTATLSGTPGSADVGDHVVALQVTESGGLTATQSFTVTVTAKPEYTVFLPLIVRNR